MAVSRMPLDAVPRFHNGSLSTHSWHIPQAERRDDTVKLQTTLRDIKTWLYPNGNKTSNRIFIPRLREALLEIHNYRILWERREWHIISVDALPNMETKSNDPLPFTIKLPEGMEVANGAMVGLHPLRLYGANSAPKFRAWIRLAYIWDKAKIKNGGYRIYATRAQVKRSAEGYLLNQNDELIRSGDPYKSRSGWKVKPGNLLQKAWYHPHAERIGVERNPTADKMPMLSDTDLVHLFYDDNSINKSAFWKRLHDAKKHTLEMEKDGYIVVEQNVIDPNTRRKGWRILEPQKADNSGI